MADAVDQLLAEQIAYYRARAPEYLASTGIEIPESEAAAAAAEITDAIDRFRPTGNVLELACGPGTWTAQLARHADTLTAVDAAPEMLALAAEEVPSDASVRFVRADLFEWVPDRRYDTVFFGFWLSHVPLERFASFWSTVADALEPGGRVFFVDDAYRTAAELIEGEASSTVRRELEDGRAFRVVKVPHRTQQLEALIRGLGWDLTVRSTAGPFFYGVGCREPLCNP